MPEVRRALLATAMRTRAAELDPAWVAERWLLTCASVLGRSTLAEQGGMTGVVTDALPAEVTVESLVVAMGRVAAMIRAEWPGDPEAAQWLEAAGRRGALTLEMASAAERESGADEQAKYLSFLSHDLRGGLNGILLMIEVLKRDLSAHASFGEQLEDLDAMRRSVLETVSLMDRFVYAERFRRGLVRVKKDRQDLRLLGDHLRHQFNASANDRRINLHITASGVAPVDRVLLSLVASSLLANAIKFARANVSLSLDGNEVGWRLVISDDGPGMNPNMATLLKSKPEPRNLLSSTGGLGLKLSALSIHAMGAELDVDVSAGTRIVVTKPQLDG